MGYITLEGSKRYHKYQVLQTSGVLNDTFDVQQLMYTSDSEDPFEDIDETIAPTPPISAAMGTLGTCSMSEYINGDNELPVCADLDDDCTLESSDSINMPYALS